MYRFRALLARFVRQVEVDTESLRAADQERDHQRSKEAGDRGRRYLLRRLRDEPELLDLLHRFVADGSPEAEAELWKAATSRRAPGNAANVFSRV